MEPENTEDLMNELHSLQAQVMNLQKNINDMAICYQKTMLFFEKIHDYPHRNCVQCKYWIHPPYISSDYGVCLAHKRSETMMFSEGSDIRTAQNFCCRMWEDELK